MCLLSLLEETDNLLSQVDQSPAISMLTSPSMLITALVSEELLKHSNFAIQVAVTSCLSEIIRGMVPDTPYSDKTMHDIFSLMISSFASLTHKSTYINAKGFRILETTANVRYCINMLDLNCEHMIVEMF